MIYESERSEGIPCNRDDCMYWNSLYEQHCSKANAVGDPGPVFCIAYRPNKVLKEQP